MYRTLLVIAVVITSFDQAAASTSLGFPEQCDVGHLRDHLAREDALQNFESYRDLVDAYQQGGKPTEHMDREAVADAMVALGEYYLRGIPETAIEADPNRAREMFAYAAAYFGKADAQYCLALMYLVERFGLNDRKLGLRWLFLAADKGQYQAQAVLGAILFNEQYTPRQAARGLMWLTLARDNALKKDTWIEDLYSAAMKQATKDERAAAFAHLEAWIKSH